MLEHVEAANAGKPITFFEVTTAVAFLAFARIPADVVLLETGLGGRFDATNVIAKPAVTALSSISMDHMQYLGDTLAKIAGEKAAIMKPGVPCVSVMQRPEAAAVIAAAAAEIGASLKVQGADWTMDAEGQGLVFTGAHNSWKVPLPSLPGRHQYENAGLALAALDQSPFAIPAFALRSGFRTIEWPARAQKLKQGPLVKMLPNGWELWLDGGHNAGGGAAVAALAGTSGATRPCISSAACSPPRRRRIICARLRPTPPASPPCRFPATTPASRPPTSRRQPRRRGIRMFPQRTTSAPR